jgi:hypothetical protein
MDGEPPFAERFPLFAPRSSAKKYRYLSRRSFELF